MKRKDFYSYLEKNNILSNNYYFSIIILSYGDYSRYVKDEENLKKGNLSLILNLIIFTFFAVFIVIGSDTFLNQKFEDLDRILLIQQI